ncbi:WS/DGAT domain-containing protein [Actinophytocola sp. KF-1]
MDDLSTVPADLLGTAFARLGQIGPNPADTWFGLVFRLAGPCPAVDELRARVAARIDRLPRLTERLVARATVHWERDPGFDIADHVNVLPAHTGVLSAHEILGDRDAARPPWGLWIAEDGDGWRLYYLVHHARQDAGGALRTVQVLLGDLAVENAPARRGRGWPALLPIALDLARTKLPAPPVPLRKYGPGRAVAVADVDLALLTEVADRTGSTVNQVHLAALSSALDRWNPRPEVARRPVNVPVDTRAAGDSDVTNRLGFMRVDLPCGDVAPAARLRAVRAAAGRRRTARYRRVWAAITRGGGHPAAAWAMRRVTDHTQVAMTLSTIRVAAPLTLADAPVLEVATVPWLPPAHACFAFLATYGDRATLSVLAPEGAPEPAALAGYWSDAVRELHRAHGEVSVGTR